MNHLHLSSLDLNLLVALDALLQERNVTRAARYVGLSQSAMSHALGRLREQFDDPLLVRAGRSMTLTPRAEALVEPLRQVLEQLEQVIAPDRAFDPQTSDQTFVIGANDYAQFTLLPSLVELLARVAPRVDLRVRELGNQPPQAALEAGELDMALTLGLPEHIPRTLFHRDLFRLRLVCMVREDHPTVGERLSIEQYAGLSHVLISARGDDGVVDWTLARHELSRRIAVVVPHYLIAPHVIARTDYILTTAESVARAFVGVLPIRLLEPPVELEGGTVSMVWHERVHQDAAHRWLRARIAEVNARLPTESNTKAVAHDGP